MYIIPIDFINLFSPYKVRISDNGSAVTFETRQGLVYEAGFVEDSTFFTEHAYQFFIVERNGIRKLLIFYLH